MHTSTNGHFTYSLGHALPYGANLSPKGVNFSIFSRHATEVRILFFKNDNDAEAFDTIVLSPYANKTGDVWHAVVHEAGAGLFYLYQIDGPFDPSHGLRFNRHKLLIDPYSRALTGEIRWDFSKSIAYRPDSPERDLSYNDDSDASRFPKSVVIDHEAFDWQGDRPLNRSLRNSVIYEAHLKGLSADQSAGVSHPGTYLGVIEMIPYFKELGITAIEFLPLQEFDEFEYSIRKNPETGEGLKNYWGYSTLAFFAPKSSWTAGDKNGGQVEEFKLMVRELHKAGIEVILDIVFNHSGEGNEFGPTTSFRGIDNKIYYMLENNARYYKNYSGCGNTLNCNHPVVRGFIVDCLRYWVLEMHVDGFRFDLGSILGRDENGNILSNPPTLIRISEDPILRNTKIIAEAWDAGGAYQVGSFPGGRWAEWNDRYRDDLRRFWKGERGMVSAFATRISGSSDLYLSNGRKPYHSINFITCHDGFTLNDLISYREKNNYLNGEDNQDGNNHNLSDDYGERGPSLNPEVVAKRKRQAKNFMTSLMVSIGTPMILGGDEILRTQGGNNNAYCQDNEISWFDYRLKEKNKEFFDFVSRLLAFRLSHGALTRVEFFTGIDNDKDSMTDIAWFDERGESVSWARAENLLAMRLDGSKAETGSDADDSDFYMMFNASAYDQYFTLPKSNKKTVWYRAIDTSLESPADILPKGKEVLVGQTRYLVESLSVVVLLGK